MQGRPAHLRRRARVRGLAPDFVCNMTKQRTKSNKSLWVLLGGALLLRLVLALVTDGYPYDMSCFVAWGDKLAAEGPAAFYSEGYFADYPPGYLWVLGLVGAIRAALHIAYESKWTYFLLALVPSLCDCGLAWLVYRTAKRSNRGVKEHTALVLTAFTAFNPLMLFDTGVWKQIDGAFALPLVLCFVLLEQRRYLPAAVLYGVALAIKPQALLFGPVLFGVLLVPLAWCFVRRLTRKPWAAATAGVLLALDFMRFSQSRLATIDVYGTFFILLGAYCMVWYCQRVLTDGVNRALLPMALGGVAFGLGCAAKWTGIYAGAGLAVLYLGVLYARWQQKRPGFRAEFRTAAVGGVLFYVLLPLCLYIGSYLPYWWRDPAFSLSDWWQCQVSMFSYHATLKATHPFESRWYTWLLGLRPVWYYRNGYLPYGMKASIAGMAGPVIWLVGLAALVGLLWHQVSGRGSRQGAGVLILYGTQLIPWMLVTRCTFLYHYFPSSMFCLAALALVLARMKHVDWAKKIAAGLCVVALVLFVLYYPALSGLPIPAWWADALNVLPSFGFY